MDECDEMAVNRCRFQIFSNPQLHGLCFTMHVVPFRLRGMAYRHERTNKANSTPIDAQLLDKGKKNGHYMMMVGAGELVIKARGREGEEHTVDILFDRLVWQNRATVNVDLVLDGDIVAENSDVFETSPLADGAVPADDGGLYPGVILYLGVLEQDAALQADTVTDDNVGADSDIGTDTAGMAYLGGWMDHDISAIDVRLGGRSEHLRVTLGE